MAEETDSRAGISCRITLGSRETIVVNHSKGGFQGGILAVEILTFMGLCSERLFACDLDGPEGRAALVRLTGDGAPDRQCADTAGRLRALSRGLGLAGRPRGPMGGPHVGSPPMIFSSMLPAAV